MIIILLIPFLIALYLTGFYNRLKTFQVRIGASVQEIGNQLKRQANLIPNLVESVKGYLKHEKAIFDQLTEARKSLTQAMATNNPRDIDQSQRLISQAMESLKVVVESNPEIKASNLVSNLMNELRDTADKLMYSRRTLIDLSADYNTAISTIPGAWLAGPMGFKPEKGLETPNPAEFTTVTTSETESPKINLS